LSSNRPAPNRRALDEDEEREHGDTTVRAPHVIDLRMRLVGPKLVHDPLVSTTPASDLRQSAAGE
jgi:hypothetical protein